MLGQDMGAGRDSEPVKLKALQDRPGRRHPSLARSRLVVFFLGSCWLLLAGCARRHAAEAPGEPPPAAPIPVPSAGAVVSDLVPTGPGEIYGLAEGDVLVGWRDDGAEPENRAAGVIRSPLDALELEITRAPRGALALQVVRGGEELWIAVRSGRWEVDFETVESAPRAGTGVRSPRSTAEAWLERARAAAARDDGQAARWYRHLAGRALAAAGRLEAAQDAFAASRSGDGAPVALLLQLEGRAWKQARVASEAELSLRAALEQRRRADPDALAVAACLVDLGELADPRRQEPFLEEAGEIYRRLAPHSMELAHVVNLLGNLALFRSELDSARRLYGEALELRRRAAPGSYRVADCYTNLGSIARKHGRLDDAERLLERSLATYHPELVYPIAITANSLGIIQRDKGSYRQARETWELALASFRRVEAESLAVAGVLNNLGNLSLRVGNLERAEALHREALELRRELAPESRDVAASLHNLGLIARQRGRSEAARRYLGEALELKERHAPDTETLANSLLELAQLSRQEGKREEAERLLRRSLAIRRRIAPRAIEVAENLVLLGRILAGMGRFEESSTSWQEGLDLLDATRTGFSFSAQERSIFASRFQDHYRDLAWMLVLRDQHEAALELLERSRARALRVMADQRTAAGSPDGAEIPALNAAATRAALDPGTRLIVFSVGLEETLVGVVGDPSTDSGIAFHRVEVSRDELRQRVEIFRALIERGRTRPQIEAALIAQGRELFDLLLAPIAAELETARRLLIVPDVPLTTLPFAALVRSEEPPRFLGEWKPLTFAASGTVFAHAKARRHTRDPDPAVTVYARSNGVGGVGRPRLAPLPGVEAEARRIADLFAGPTRVLLDDEASESALKSSLRSEPGASAYLHFATHAVLDHRVPLDSALMLAPGDGEDGRLSAFEVIAELELQSDLVTLSACGTGLGRELSGEGVLGLSHAFLFAGARTTLTSLWPVSDASTAEWMAVFYAALRQGAPRDEAVMRAQARVRERSVWRQPYFWAAFQLWGDWGG